MKMLVWYVGRTLQILGLITVGFALFIGLKTNDSRQEMTYLGVGACEFLLGIFALKRTSSE